MRGAILISLILMVSAGAGPGSASQKAPAADWPRWRGPNADGVADGRNLPLHWGKTKNVRWSAPLPGWGTSSPVVYGGRVFVTSQVPQGGTKVLLTLCYDRTTGQE